MLYRMLPTFVNQLTCHANTIVTDRVNKAVYDAFNDDDSFENIVTGENGKVTSVAADTAKINRLKAEATIRVQDELNAITSDYIYIPLGAVSSFPMFNGYGIRVPVKVVPLTTVDADFKENFEKSGINQTLYSLNMDIIVNVKYSGFLFCKSDTLSTTVPLISMVINGDVLIGK
jgi:sporulation protein YunB